MRIPVNKIKKGVLSLKGRNITLFCVFLALSAMLWLGMSLNVETQRDVRCQLILTGCPDSVMRISPMPQAVHVNVRGAGTQLFLNSLWHKPVLRLDYHQYLQGNRIDLSEQDMRTLAQHEFGQNCQIVSVSPDTLHLVFTSRPPVRMPVIVDTRITTMPNCSLTGPVTSNIDSVYVYSLSSLPSAMVNVHTSVLTLRDVSKSQTVRVPLEVPRGCRAVPDSVDLRIEVEPMISRTVKVPIRTLNVPQGMKLILLPNTVEVSYMLPLSKYNSNARPSFNVSADFHSLNGNFNSSRIALKLAAAKGGYLNVYMKTDSVEYIIEQD